MKVKIFKYGKHWDTGVFFVHICYTNTLLFSLYYSDKMFRLTSRSSDTTIPQATLTLDQILDDLTQSEPHIASEETSNIEQQLEKKLTELKATLHPSSVDINPSSTDPITKGLRKRGDTGHTNDTTLETAYSTGTDRNTTSSDDTTKPTTTSTNQDTLHQVLEKEKEEKVLAFCDLFEQHHQQLSTQMIQVESILADTLAKQREDASRLLEGLTHVPTC
jgi:hypothetical protein